MSFFSSFVGSHNLSTLNALMIDIFAMVSAKYPLLEVNPTGGPMVIRSGSDGGRPIGTLIICSGN